MTDAAPIDWSDARVLVTGASGFLGRHVVRTLLARGVREDRLCAPRSRDYDLRDPAACARLFGDFPDADAVIHLAGRVGGIQANRAHPAGFLYDNAAMALHVIEAARRGGLADRAGAVVMVGSMTSYPESTPVPFREGALFAGPLAEQTRGYAFGKLVGLETLIAYGQEFGLASSYLIPVNLYGPGDNFDPATSHFVGALVRRCLEAVREGREELVCWGTGEPTRDFLYIEDAAAGVVLAAERLLAARATGQPAPCDTRHGAINLSPGNEHSIREAVEIICRVIGFRGRVVWDTSKPEGQARRSLDPSRARERLGFEARVSFEEGVRRTAEWIERERPF
ncbi:MAG: NAD-dependent epimerase/dehydratase family protein [Phycisphaerales bacterium]|nr:MAG: NAD-dependent epimerase/dehydratase family protein [Phycisphaerales bacterium]